MSNINDPESEDSNAAFLRDQFKQQNSNPAIILCDANGNAKTPPPAGELTFKEFPDGIVFRHSPNKGKAGTVCVHDAAGLVIGVVVNAQMGDIVCKALDVFKNAIQLNRKQDSEDADAAIAADADYPPGSVRSGNSVVDEAHDQDAK